VTDRHEVPATEHLPVTWTAAALDLGYHTRRLWSLLQSVWSKAGEGVQPVVPALVGVHHALLALDGRLNPAEIAHARTLMATVGDIQTDACLFIGGLKTEIFMGWYTPAMHRTGLVDLTSYEERVERLLPVLIEERRPEWDYKMTSAWDELRLISQRAVVGEVRLVAWWEIGFWVADLTVPTPPFGVPNAGTDQRVENLHRAIEKLPVEERSWVRDALPVEPPADHTSPDALAEAFREFRSLLPEHEKRRRMPGEKGTPVRTPKKRPSRAEVPDDYEANIRIRKYLDANPRAGIRDVAEAVGLSVGKVTKLDAWRQEMERRHAAKPQPRKAERPLTDEMLATIGRHDDPADTLVRDDAIWQWLLEQAKPTERAELRRKGAAERAELIRLAREQYEIARGEHGE